MTDATTSAVIGLLALSAFLQTFALLRLGHDERPVRVNGEKWY